MRNIARLRRAAILSIVTTMAIGVVAIAPVAGASFEHAPVIAVDGDLYYLDGPPDGVGGGRDIPGHTWVVAGHSQLVGKHYNTGPLGAPGWWSSDAPDGALLYTVHGIIDTWSPQRAIANGRRGYGHYHELVSVLDGSRHPTKVVWLRHIARSSFTLDGGPHPELTHPVSPGLDRDFIPNGMMPYSP